MWLDLVCRWRVYGDPSFGTEGKGERTLEAAADARAEVSGDIRRGRL
jgi:hypothetical protein